MSHSIGWLPLGVLLIFLVGFVIRVRLKEHTPFGTKARPRWLESIENWCTKLILNLPNSLGWFVIGFVLIGVPIGAILNWYGVGINLAKFFTR